MGAEFLVTPAQLAAAVAVETARAQVAETLLVRTVNNQSGNYTITATDCGAIVEASGSGGQTITVPLNLAGFPIGGEVRIMRTGSNFVGMAAAGGVTINSKGGLLFVNGLFAEIRLRKQGTNTWVLTGDLA